jgi:hypothetical protein
MPSEFLRFPFFGQDREFNAAGALPYLPITLTYGNATLDAMGLLDTGASVNVLPYGLGRQLGAAWERQTVSVRLTGNLADFEARALVVTATVGTFAPVRLAFAWTRAERTPLLLGQVNFFQEFDVCFFRQRGVFEVRPAYS